MSKRKHGKNIFDNGLGNNFLGKSPKAQATKAEKTSGVTSK